MFESVTTQQPRSIWADWVLRGALGLLMVLIGVAKFSTDPHSEWVKLFDQIGIGQWFRYFTGIVETLGGLLLLIPRTVTAGLALFGSAMLGAAAVWIFVLHQPFNSIIPGGFFIGLLMFWLNRG